VLCRSVEVLTESLEIDPEKALEIANMQICNIANGGKITK